MCSALVSEQQALLLVHILVLRSVPMADELCSVL